MESGKRQEQTLMRLRRREFDALKGKPGWQALSDFVASFVVGANLQVGHLAQVARSSSHQTPAVWPNAGALTNRSFGRFASLRAKQLSR